MSIFISLSDIDKPIKRINKEGSNCSIGDIITWSSAKKQKDMYGKITKIGNTCVYIDLYEYEKIYQGKIYLERLREIDNVCYNKLTYNRKMHIIKLNRI